MLKVQAQHPELQVAPFAGAWIETRSNSNSSVVCNVAPFAGAWIETIHPREFCLVRKTSLPSRERGLKRIKSVDERISAESLPSRERGLKLLSADPFPFVLLRRSLRGSVD